MLTFLSLSLDSQESFLETGAPLNYRQEAGEKGPASRPISISSLVSVGVKARTPPRSRRRVTEEQGSIFSAFLRLLQAARAPFLQTSLVAGGYIPVQ